MINITKFVNRSREIAGSEHVQVRMLLKFIEPFEITNNEFFSVERYALNNRMYDVIYYKDHDPIIKEING